jgi:hypothetical protein
MSLRRERPKTEMGAPILKRQQMFKIEVLNFDQLSDVQKATAPNNGHGKKHASYIRVTHNNRLVCIESDAMEPEDALFCRDLSWIPNVLEECYKCGKNS